ncbi:MAG: helix-turn-helix transcriptional regulator [Actinomycetota bacterium]|nr:helix-turn-helix transcriptional regulator [Actinomycetota bacterium]
MGLTQEALGKSCGLSKEEISRLENGRSSPGWLRVWGIAEALGMSLSELDAEAEELLDLETKGS